MGVNWIQAAIFGIFACLASMPGMGGTTIGNYTLGRPLVGGLVVGLVMGDVTTGIIVGAAIQVVYIALVTPGGTVSADVRAVSYMGIPLAVMAIHQMGIDPNSVEAAQLATTLGAAVGTLGTVLFYGTATMNLIWQHIGWKRIDKGHLKSIYLTNHVLPWISHFFCSFLPTFFVTLVGSNVVDLMKQYLPMEGLAMKTLFTVGSLLPAVGIAILLKQVVNKPIDVLIFAFGFTLCAALNLNLISTVIIAGVFALVFYQIKEMGLKKSTVASDGGSAKIDDDDEEDI